MTYQQLKWFILLFPTLIVGLWEYVRHEYLLSYISMETGNWLTPLITFLLTITLLRQLFVVYENMQEQLKKERAQKAILEERERIARELHDDIAQSLFLCSVHVNRLKKRQPDPEWVELDKGLRYIHDYVRDSITQLKSPKKNLVTHWQYKWAEAIAQFEASSGIRVKANIQIDETKWPTKDKINLYFCIQEALTNILKHAQASQVTIDWAEEGDHFRLTISDNGKGLPGNPFHQEGCYGLSIMKERCREIGATLQFFQQDGWTKLVIEKRGE